MLNSKCKMINAKKGKTLPFKGVCLLVRRSFSEGGEQSENGLL